MRRIDSGCIVNDNISVGGAGGGTAAPPLFGHLKKLKHNGKWHNRWFVAEQHFLSYTGSDREELRFVVDLNAPDATVRFDIQRLCSVLSLYSVRIQFSEICPHVI